MTTAANQIVKETFVFKDFHKVNIMFEKLKAVAIPVLTGSISMDSEPPKVSYIKVNLDPSLNRLKITLYVLRTHAQEVIDELGVGYLTNVKGNACLQKITVKDDRDLWGPFKEKILSQFDGIDHARVESIFSAYGILKSEETEGCTAWFFMRNAVYDLGKAVFQLSSFA